MHVFNTDDLGYMYCFYMLLPMKKRISILEGSFYENELGHEKMCLMSYANNKGADQPDQSLCCSLLR